MNSYLDLDFLKRISYCSTVHEMMRHIVASCKILWGERFKHNSFPSLKQTPREERR
jgi:hypothetical protein